MIRIIYISCFIVGFLFSMIFFKPIIHSYYWILRKIGLRKPAQIESMEYLGNRQYEIRIDKLDPGEEINIGIPLQWNNDKQTQDNI